MQFHEKFYLIFMENNSKFFFLKLIYLISRVFCLDFLKVSGPLWCSILVILFFASRMCATSYTDEFFFHIFSSQLLQVQMFEMRTSRIFQKVWNVEPHRLGTLPRIFNSYGLLGIPVPEFRRRTLYMSAKKLSKHVQHVFSFGLARKYGTRSIGILHRKNYRPERPIRRIL